MSEPWLITGGAGFVGSNLAIFLKEKNPGRRLVAFDNLKRRGAELNLPRLCNAGVEFLHGDIRCPEDLEAIGPFSLLIECSAEPSVMAGVSNSPGYLLQTNLVGTINCLEQCRKYKSDFLFLSTSRVYSQRALNGIQFTAAETRLVPVIPQPIPGFSSEGVAEDFPLSGPRSLYGATKLASELLIEEYAHLYGIRTVINRCGVIAGPWQMGKVDQGFVALWVARHLLGGDLAYIGYGGTGKQVRDILHIDDLAALIEIQLGDIEKFMGKVFNVGGGQKGSVSLAELTRICQRLTGRSITIGSIPQTRSTDIPFYVTDSGRIRELAMWAPRKAPEEIVEDFCTWIRRNEPMVRHILA